MVARNNSYPKWITELVAKQVKDQNIQRNAYEALTFANGLLSNSKSYTFLLFYTGQKGEHLIRFLRKNIHHMLPENAQTSICYTRTKLGTNSVTSKVWLRNPTNIKLCETDRRLSNSMILNIMGQEKSQLSTFL